MTRRNRYLTMLMVAAAVMLVTLAMASTATAASLYSLKVASGETYVVTESTTLQRLTIEQGGIVKAAAGYSLTMTVDGVETGGDILATPTGIFDPAWMRHPRG